MRFPRKENCRSEDKRIFIFTEGEKTEVNYFESKKREIRKNNIEIDGDGFNTLSLVERAITYLKKNKIKLSFDVKDDECWVVFDKDSFEKYNFDNAIEKARANNIKVAYSNESFELWFLLHFIYLSSALDRDQLRQKLDEKMKEKCKVGYKKNSEKIYFYLKDLEVDAIKHSKRLLEKEHKNVKLCSDKNPSTTVYLLVESLNKLRV